MCNLINTHTHTHTVSLIPPWEDQCEWHRMTRMTGPDCAVICNLVNTHTHTHIYIHGNKAIISEMGKGTRTGSGRAEERQRTARNRTKTTVDAMGHFCSYYNEIFRV